MNCTSLLVAAICLLSWPVGFGRAAVLLEGDTAPKCIVNITGVSEEKSIGDSWQLPAEPCLTHTCSLQEESNVTAAIEVVTRQTCFMNCSNEFALVTRTGNCCGECVRTKCRSAIAGNTTTIRNVGDTWKSADGCTINECVRTANRVDVATYAKRCPPLATGCPRSRILQHDCCPVCAEQPLAHTARLNRQAAGQQRPPPPLPNSQFVYDHQLHDNLTDPATYANHVCARECQPGAPPMHCNYTFIIEWYETLSKACFDCPRTAADCLRPHCIAGDGMARSIVAINRQMPGPRLQVCLGDTLQVDVVNQLMGESTTLHWHGMHQRETPFMDGVPMVTQCPIAPHTSFRYRFRADHEGTHWWHSHTGVQRSDGALGALIVRRPRAEEPPQVSRLYDFDRAEHTMIVQDWDHVSTVASFNSFHHSLGDNKPKNILINARGRFGEQQLRGGEMAANAGAVAEPETEAVEEVPASTESMANDVDWMQVPQKMEQETTTVEEPEPETTTTSQQNARRNPFGLRQKRQTIISEPPAEAEPITPLEVFPVRAGGRYRFRLINAGFLNCPVELSVDGHNLTVIASDGWYVEPVEVASLVSYAGERFDFVLNANQPVANYWVRVRGLMDCDERFTSAHQVAVLRYEGAPEERPSAEWPTYDWERQGLQMNALNRGTGLEDSVSIAELTSLHATDERILKPQADFKFYVYYDFYDKDNPHFNHPTMYSNADMATAATQFIGPQLNRITMKMPHSPLLVARDGLDSGAFCNESSLAARGIDCTEEFCECSHVLQVPLNATVELVLVDEGYKYDANHPFHLHGQGFYVVAMERLRPSGIDVAEIQALDNAGNITRRLRGAPLKDTITVPDGGYTIVRFVADNPGYWLFHCHIEFHAEVGMSLVFKVGDHSQMPPVPRNFPQCSSYMPRGGGSGADSVRQTSIWLVGLMGIWGIAWRRMSVQ